MPSADLKRLSDTLWEVPQRGNMRVPGRIVADEALIRPITRDRAAEQVANVACLPGIVGYAWAMPDAHWGYGFPIGGVAATDPAQDGVISPGGVGYDINCGVRLMATNLDFTAIKGKVHDLLAGLYRDIPCGVGSEGAIPKLSKADLQAVLARGARWAVEHGYGHEADIVSTEEGGQLANANPDAVSERAYQRGANQLGTLGSGNHFVELGVVEAVYDDDAAALFGLHLNQVTVFIHSGSRALGYQVCDDYLKTMGRAAARYGIVLPDRQLCCAPVNSPEGRQYLGAMSAAANYAWANRQIMMALARKSLSHNLRASEKDVAGRLVYDVCHNIAKLETHEVSGKKRQLCVHRKGATRAFPGSRDEVPGHYRALGHPVLVPGDMGTGSYVCVGTEQALTSTFGSACHGAGRMLSRTAARKQKNANDVIADLKAHNIEIMARNKKTVAEEMPDAYKDIDRVVEVLELAGLARRVARIRPIGVVKG